MSLFGNRVLANVKIKLYWSKVSPKSNMIGVLTNTKGTFEHKHAQQGECHRKPGIMLPQPKTIQIGKRPGTDPFLAPSEGA